MHIQFLVNCPIITDRSSFLTQVDQDEVVELLSPRSELDPAGVSPGRPKQWAAGIGGSVIPGLGSLRIPPRGFV
jgi:hypothetical protein